MSINDLFGLRLAPLESPPNVELISGSFPANPTILLRPQIELLESRIAPAFAAQIDVADLNGHNGFELIGEAAKDTFGRSVGFAGDVNGDGFDDLLVGADYADAHGKDSGAAYLIFGGARGFPAKLDVAALDGRNGFRITGPFENSLLGSSVSGAGDVNGDGIDDMILGARVAARTGAAYVIFGTRDGFPAKLNVDKLDGSDGFAVYGRFDRSETGISVSAAGDFNGDGFSDVIIGAQGDGPPALFPGGAAYVVFGKAAGYAAVMNVSDLDGTQGFVMEGAPPDLAGSSVSGAGDVNGDGFDDVIVGAYFAAPHGGRSGAAYVVFGKAAGFTKVNLAALDGNEGFKLNGEATYDEAGISVSGAGDVNGDGFSDLIVGSSHGSDLNRGAGYVVFGKDGGFPAQFDLSTLEGNNGFRVIGTEEADVVLVGESVSGAGDVNGDGFADLVLSAYIGNRGSSGGYVVFGKAGGFSKDFDVASIDGLNGFKIGRAVINPLHDSRFVVSGSGDVNGDGLADVIMGARRGYSNGIESGTAYVVFGGDPGRLHIAKSGLSASYTDPDGDKVTVQTSVGKLTAEMFDMRVDGLGFQLEKFTLTDAAFTKTSLTISALQQDANKDGTIDGDGAVNVGFIEATGLDLGKVKIAGDLGQIDAGDGDPAKAAMALLKVQSLGATGTVTQDPAAASLHSDIAGDVGKLKVKGNVAAGVTLAASGRLGTGSVAGDISGATISALGLLAPGSAAKAVAIGSLTIGGNVSASRILAGYDLTGLAANADVSIGTIFVDGAWTASDLVAGIADVTGDGFGRNDAVIPGGSSAIIARIAEVTLRGGGFGTSENSTDSFAITAEQLGEVRIFGTPLPLTEGKDNLPISGDADFRAVEV